MQIDRSGGPHLTYCTNIHPADGWPAVDANLRRYAPALKQRFAPERPFGIGLRLSARDARELQEGSNLDTFRRFLDDEGLYVAIINGFPYGSFHGTPVKEQVYAPDWRDEARVAYTLDLIAILVRLLPDALDGGISTSPISYKAWLPSDDRDGWTRAATNIGRIAAALARTRRETGRFIHLDIEPEPDCVLETSAETIEFFERWLRPIATRTIAGATGLAASDAEQALFDHVQVCFDCCHFAVEHEDPVDAATRLEAAGIRIGRIQLSSALRVDVPDGSGAAALDARLRPFADPVYLHQVVSKGADGLRHYPDLGPALDAREAGPAEWRIHFHVPLFTSDYDGLGSTQDDVRRLIDAAVARPITTHLEIETYTWSVLPGSLKIDLLDSIAREYEWVLGVARR
ncbi:MAG: metabolite traffic protein EboE [Acidobacteriota bacterium]